MISLIDALTKDARENLAREHTLDILNAAFEIEADPGRPDDEWAMRRNIRVIDAFTRDIPWLNRERETLRKICEQYDADFDSPALTMLRAALLAKRYELEEIKELNTARPLLHLVTPMVGVWAVAWTITLDDGDRDAGSSAGEGTDRHTGLKPEIRYREYLNDGIMDPVTLAKVRDRLREFSAVMDRILGRLCPETGPAD